MKGILILSILLFFNLKIYSCSCAEKPTIEKNWEGANEVFEGKIIRADSLLFGNNGAKIYSFTVKIIKSYKNEFYKTRELRTIISQDEGSCDFLFQIGKNYLIYAKAESQTLACSICSRTNLLENIEEKEFVKLNELFKKYNSNSSEVSTVRLENNTSYQIGLVKNSFEEKIKFKNLIIYIFFGFIILLIVIMIIRKRKN